MVVVVVVVAAGTRSPERLSAISLPPPAPAGLGAGRRKVLGFCRSRTRVTLAMGGRDFSRG